MHKIITGLAAAILASSATFANAGSWVLDGAASSISFGSIKKAEIGETNSFSDLSGGVDADGNVMVSIGLGSVQTNIDIRNERMIEHVFGGMAAATVSAMVDMETLEGLAVGDMTSVTVDATLDLLGVETGFDAPMIAVRLSETRVMLVSDGMVFLSTYDLGIDAGIDVLQELASLPAITRTTPVTVRFVFDME